MSAPVRRHGERGAPAPPAGGRPQARALPPLPRLLALAIALLLASCGEEDREPRPGWVPRRTDVPFAAPRPTADAAGLAVAKRIDEIEQLFEQGRDASAQEKLDAFFADGLEHPRASDLQGRLLARRGDRAGAAAWFEKAVAGSPRWLEPRVRLADCYLKLERLLAAEQVFREIDTIAPRHPWGPYGMAAVARMRGDAEQAVSRADEALRRDGEHGPSLWLRADLARTAGDTQLEERLIRRYAQAEPRDANGARRLADIDLAAGREHDARRGYERAWDLGGDMSVARRLAELAQTRGDAAEAARWREAAGLPKTQPPPAPKDGGAQRQ